ncbi:MAG: PRC-barrel domain-containing protein [Candidatus Diapherotrites archaeon]|nr:PRC-barrel domain-containing protein [Candidatus Diapherotrites archaeon]
MSMRLSKLFGMDVYDADGGYKGKVYDIIIDLEKGRLEKITTEPLKVKSKAEAKKILSEKSISYRTVKSAKDIIVVDGRAPIMEEPEEEPQRGPIYRPGSLRPGRYKR